MSEERDAPGDVALMDDEEYAAYVRREIELGIADCEAGRVYTTEEVLRYLNLK